MLVYDPTRYLNGSLKKVSKRPLPSQEGTCAKKRLLRNNGLHAARMYVAGNSVWVCQGLSYPTLDAIIEANLGEQ